jgi:hypothetical protein
MRGAAGEPEHVELLFEPGAGRRVGEEQWVQAAVQDSVDSL